MLNFKRKTMKDRKGFSLIEVLISVAILALILIPLSMNMITSSRINSQSKNTAASSDLTASILNAMQTVDLSDILTDVNGYNVDEYGTPLPYKLTENTLSNFKINKAYEVKKDDSGKTYTPVVKNDSVGVGTNENHKVNSSITIRNVNDGIKAYFKGNPEDKYSFVLNGVENDEMLVDVLVNIEPKKSFDMVNITSMSQTEILYKAQPPEMDMDVAREFERANYQFVSLQKGAAADANWFYDNMTRDISIDIKKNALSDAITIIINATYKVDALKDEKEVLSNTNKTITKPLGSFSTNSTAEFARGIYLYYHPLLNTPAGQSRDRFVIKNNKGLSVPVYLIALASDNSAFDITKNNNYNPMIKVDEPPSTGDSNHMRTIVCSNISDENGHWKKEIPVGKELVIKGIGNLSEQQTLYSVNVKVYTHRESSFDYQNAPDQAKKEGEFKPKAKDLIVETEGSFIDTSEKLDIDSTANNIRPPAESNKATVNAIGGLVYNGSTQVGVKGSHVDIVGGAAIDAGQYTASATPKEGYTWSDGTTVTKTIVWEIQRAAIPVPSAWNYNYDGNEHRGVSYGNDIDNTMYNPYLVISGSLFGTESQEYKCQVAPDSNHYWQGKDPSDPESYSPIEFKWEIFSKDVKVVWDEISWAYDGTTHEAKCHAVYTDGTPVPVDATQIILQNQYIREVGSQDAVVVGFSNQNYKLAAEANNGQKQRIEVRADSSASVELNTTDKWVYDGLEKYAVKHSNGVSFTGTISARDVPENGGVYRFQAKPQPGYTWDDGTTDIKEYTWSITPRPIRPADMKDGYPYLKYGPTKWTYTGDVRRLEVTVMNTCNNDVVNAIIENNEIQDAGTKTAVITGVDNRNYILPGHVKKTLEIERAQLASFVTYNFDYTGHLNTGVVGKHVDITGTYEATDCNVQGEKVEPYTATVTPHANYAWEDGTFAPRTAQWYINPIRDAWFWYSDYAYTGQVEVSPHMYNAHHVSGDIQAKDKGKYTGVLAPDKNHAWDIERMRDFAVKDMEHGNVQNVAFTWYIKDIVVVTPTAPEKSFVYDKTKKSPYLSAEVDLTKCTVTGDIEAVNAGKYQIVFKLKDPNTTWEDGTKDTRVLNWEIKQRPIKIAFDKNNWIYDKKPHAGTARIVDGVIPGDTVNLLYSDNVATSAIAKQFTVTGVTNPNYTLKDGPQKGNMSISPRTLTYNASNTTTSFTYNATTHKVVPKLNNICDGDVVNAVCKNNTRRDYGTQNWELTGIDNPNYIIDRGTYSMNVAKRTLGINWGQLTFTYNKSMHKVSPVPTNVCSGDSVSFVCSNNTRTNAGTQEVQITGIQQSAAQNYTLALPAKKTMTVNKANQSAPAIYVNNFTSDGSFHTLFTLSGDANWSWTGPEGTYNSGRGSGGDTARRAGDYTIRAWYPGDSNYNASATTVAYATVYARKDASYAFNGRNYYGGSHYSWASVPSGATTYLYFGTINCYVDANNVPISRPRTYYAYFDVYSGHEWVNGGTERATLTVNVRLAVNGGFN